MKQSVIEEINKLEQFRDDDLFDILGRREAPIVMGVDDEGEVNFAERGKGWWTAQRDAIQKRVCVPGVLDQCEGENWEKYQVYAAVVDAISGLFGGPTLAVVALLIVRVGLKKYCHFR